MTTKIVDTAPFAGSEEYIAKYWVTGDDGFAKQIEKSYFTRGKNAHKRVATYVERHTQGFLRIVSITYV